MLITIDGIKDYFALRGLPQGNGAPHSISCPNIKETVVPVSCERHRAASDLSPSSNVPYDLVVCEVAVEESVKVEH